MCQAPLTMWVGPKGEQRPQLVACHKCEQCLDRRVNDMVGRCIAETRTSVATHAVTLTYGRVEDSPDHVRAVLLTYRDVQTYFKLLRSHGYPVRYLAVGEYGSMKARAHWHVILFWQGAPRKLPSYRWQGDYPVVALEQRIDEEHWPHGFSYWEEPSFPAFRYVCKYALKGQGELEQRVLPRLSKLPPLGTLYFRRLAEQHVYQHLSPQSPGNVYGDPQGNVAECYEYSFAEVRRKDGAARRFLLRGKSLELFLSRFVRCWKEKHGDKPWPHSRLVDEFLDRQARPELDKQRTVAMIQRHADRLAAERKAAGLRWLDTDQIDHELAERLPDGEKQFYLEEWARIHGRPRQ